MVALNKRRTGGRRPTAEGQVGQEGEGQVEPRAEAAGQGLMVVMEHLHMMLIRAADDRISDPASAMKARGVSVR